MYVDDDNVKPGDEEEIFSGGEIGDDVIDEFSDESHIGVEEEIESLPHLHEDEEEGLYDFFGDEDDRDSMY